MIFHGQPIEYYQRINNLWRKRIRRSRLKIRAKRRDFFGNIRSLYVKQYRGNYRGNASYRHNYAKKLAIYYDYKKDLERVFGETGTPQFLLERGNYNFRSSTVLKYLRKTYGQFKFRKYLRDITANKKFYKKFNKTTAVRHLKNLQLHRVKSFLGKVKNKQLRDIWRSGTIKGNKFSANLFIFRYISRLPHLLHFCGFAINLQLSQELVSKGFVSVNDIIVKDLTYLVPRMVAIQLHITNNLIRICGFLLFPYFKTFVYSFLEINWKLFTVRFLRIPVFREVFFAAGHFDHMLLYESLAQSIK
jgi:ribosomal protein S4